MPRLVSVVVPCFNYGRYLNDCVASLTSQSYANWECIIVDDGSTDDTADVCARLRETDPRVKYVRQENSGLSAARNAGIRLTQGEFVQLLDADDLLETNKLKVQAEFLEQHRDTDIVVGDTAFFSASLSLGVREGSRRVLNASHIPRGPNGVLGALVRENICAVNAALVRRSVFDSVGLFNESLRAHEDWEFWLRCATRGQRFAFISAGGDCAMVRNHGSNMSTRRDLMLNTAISVREHMASLLPDHLAADNAERLSELKWRFGIDLIRAGRPEEGWKLYRDGLRSARRKPSVLLRLFLLVPGVAAAARFNRRIFH